MFLANKLNKGGSLGGYQISRSLRFNSADSAYLNRTPASASNRRTWTWSGWVKRSNLSASGYFFTGNSALSDAGFLGINFGNGDKLEITGWATTWRLTTQVFRDPSAFYHLVIVLDTTQATANNRIRLYVNGSEVTVFDTTNNPTQNADLGVNTASPHYLSTYDGTNNKFNGYMTEVNFIDGQALTPSSFGETNAQTGVWQPKAYSGSYGTNGFYLNFSDNSNTTAATLGKDYSGNGNNWTPNNFSVTAGAGNDSLVDSPTSYGTDTGVGGTVRGNYCTWNAVDNLELTLTNGNLDASFGVAAWRSARSTIGMSSGKWYCEITMTTVDNIIIGLMTSQAALNNNAGQDAYGWGYYSASGNKKTNGTLSAYGASYTNGDIIGIAFDADAGTLTFYKNNTSQGTAFTGLTSGPYMFAISLYGTCATTVNFGQRAFAYTAPSGFKALCTQNLPVPTIGATTATQAGKFFNTVLYTGTDSAQTITGVGFQPDYVWLKNRTAANAPKNLDVLRGAGWSLSSAETGAEANQTNAFTAFTSDGFSVATNGGEYNASGRNYVAWNWKANGSGSTNTAGSITSTVSANTTSGFSVVTYTGTGANATVGHGLGVAPSMVIVKSRSASPTDWRVFASVLNSNSKWLALNTTEAATTESGYWNTGVTSSVFGLGNYSYINGSGSTYVAYCFAEVAGYSKFGSYTGNGSSDGVFVYTGFRPAFLMIKRVDAVGEDWFIYDATRSPNNANNLRLEPNLSDAEVATSNVIDFLSNGFKLRNSATSQNSNGINYIFAAFASAPQKFALAR